MSHYLRITLISIACLTCVLPASAQPDDTRAVIVHVTVQDSAGDPIPEVGLALRSGPEGKYARRAHPAFTDPAGRATLAVDVPREHSSVEIVPCAAMRTPLTAVENRGATTRYNDLKRVHSFRSVYSLPLDPDQNEYNLLIETRPAVTISGRLVDVDGSAISGGAIARGCDCTAGAKRDGDRIGNFALVGFPRGAPAEIAVSGNGKVTRFMRLLADQTQADVDLGDIVLNPIEGTSRVRLASTSVLPGGVESSVLQTVISADGNHIVSVVVDAADGRARMSWLEPSQGWLLPGRYYVLPTAVGFGGDDTGWQLLDLIRAGRAGAHPELPSFVAVAGQEVSITIDPKETARKIRAAAEAELLPP